MGNGGGGGAVWGGHGRLYVGGELMVSDLRGEIGRERLEDGVGGCEYTFIWQCLVCSTIVVDHCKVNYDGVIVHI